MSSPPTPEAELPNENKPNTKVSRRKFLKYAGLAAVGVAVAGGAAYYLLDYAPNQSAASSNATIAWNHQIQSLHPYALPLSLEEESPLDAMYDRFIQQDRTLNYIPGVLTSWAWSSDLKSINLSLRNDVTFHNGDPLTADDIEFSIQTEQLSTSVYSGVWNIITSITKNSDTSLTLATSHYDPAFLDWFGFLGGFIIPKNYYTSVGATGFAQNPIGCGPYKFVSFQNDTLKLQAYDKYWQGSPSIQNIVFLYTPDPSSRAAAIQSGEADFTLQLDISVIPSITSAGFTALKPFTTDIAQFLINPSYAPFKDLRARQALGYAIDRNSLVTNVLNGYGLADYSVEGQNYLAFDPSFTVPFDPNMATQLLAQAGYNSSNPLSFHVVTTQGVTLQDYEITQACAQMWQNVGMNVTVDVEPLAQITQQKQQSGGLDPVTFFVWSNGTGDPENDVGYTYSPDSPFSVWSGMKGGNQTDQTGLMSQASQMIDPVFSEPNETTRITEAKAAIQWVVQQGLGIPIFQQAQPLVMKQKLNYNPWPQGWVRPYSMSYSS